MNNKIQYTALSLLLLAFSVNARMAIMHEKTFDLSYHELSIQQPVVMCPGDTNNQSSFPELRIQIQIAPETLHIHYVTFCGYFSDNQIKHGNHIIEITGNNQRYLFTN